MSRANELSLFDTVLEPLFMDIFSPKVPLQTAPRLARMLTDIREFDSNYLIEIDVPGINKENITIELDDGYLTVSVKQEEAKEESKGNYKRQERFYGSQSRRFAVSPDLVEEDIKAKFDNGVLKIEIPKKEPVKPEKKTINIE